MIVNVPFDDYDIGIDLTGKYSRSRRGNVYILTCINYFTKYAEAFQISNKEAPTICRGPNGRAVLALRGSSLDNVAKERNLITS